MAVYLSDKEPRQGLDWQSLAAGDVPAAGTAPPTRAGLGRAHAHALPIIARDPGFSTAELLGLVKISKQILHRVYNGFIEGGFAERKSAMQDRRTRAREVPTGMEGQGATP